MDADGKNLRWPAVASSDQQGVSTLGRNLISQLCRSQFGWEETDVDCERNDDTIYIYINIDKF